MEFHLVESWVTKCLFCYYGEFGESALGPIPVLKSQVGEKRSKVGALVWRGQGWMMVIHVLMNYLARRDLAHFSLGSTPHTWSPVVCFL